MKLSARSSAEKPKARLALSARKKLVRDWHYGGSMNDSAAMNVSPHKEVTKKLAANGARVPQDLLNS